MIWKIYHDLVANPLILEKVDDRIKFYEYPETGEVDKPFIIIDPLATPRVVGTGDDKRIVYEYLYQVDVRTKTLNDTQLVMESVSDVFWNKGFTESGSGIDEYDTGIYRQAKRFVGRFENI